MKLLALLIEIHLETTERLSHLMPVLDVMRQTVRQPRMPLPKCLTGLLFAEHKRLRQFAIHRNGEKYAAAGGAESAPGHVDATGIGSKLRDQAFGGPAIGAP